MKKKILSLALTLALSLSLAVPAMAVSVTEVPTDYVFTDAVDRLPPFSDGLARVKNSDGLFGFIDRTGREVVPCQYQYAWDFSEGLAYVQNADGLFGFIDKTGKEVIPCQYHWARNFDEGLAAVQNSQKLYGFIDKTGKEVIPCQYHWAKNFDEGLAYVQNADGLSGFIDKTGREVTPYQYKYAESFSDGLLLVKNSSGLYGFIDKTGKEVIPCQYRDAMSFSEGVAAVMNVDAEFGFIDKTGKEVIPFSQYQYVDSFSEGLAAVLGENLRYGVIDRTGAEIVPFRYKNIGLFQGGTALARDEDHNVFVLSVDGGEHPTVSGFTDVRVTDFFADAVKWAVDSGITSGTSKDTFSPERTCSTAEILTLLWRASGSPKAAASAAVPAGQYYTDAANWAVEKGLTGAFDADVPATRLATVTYLWKLAGSPAVAGDHPFTDLTGDAQAVVWALEQNITTGTGADTFSPDKTCTRGEIVTFLYRDLA